MTDARDRLRDALDHVALSDDVEAAHAAVVTKARRIRRRRRVAATVALVATTALVGALAMSRGEHRRIAVTTPAPSSGSGPERIVAITRDRGLVVLDTSTGSVTATLDDSGKPLAAVSASPNGRDVYYVTGAGGYDPTCGKARIVHHSLGEAAGVTDPVAPGIFPAVDPSGTRLAYLACDGPSGYADTLVIRDLRTSTARRIPVNPRDSSWWATAPRWSADGRFIATRVVQGPAGGSPLRILDLERDPSLADARVVMFSDAEDVFGYLGSTGDLLGAIDAATHESWLVAMDPATGAPRRKLFALAEFPVSAIADATGRNVLALADGVLYRWSTGDQAATRLLGSVVFADWLPSATAP